MALFIETRGLTKNYGSLKANDDVSIQVNSGEIHGIVGENGAGKSTLMKMLYGMVQPDSGDIYVRDKKVHFQGPLDAVELGIGMVHQHFMLLDRLNVLENFILGQEPSSKGWIHFQEAQRKLLELTQAHACELVPGDRVETLTVGQKQRLEVLKLLYRESDCLIFDEPTGVLTPQEVNSFLESLKKLKALGKTILLITHKLSEVLAVADQITVMKGGRVITTVSASVTNAEVLARFMVGREVTALNQRKNRTPHTSSKTVLELKNVAGGKLKQVSLHIRQGEILGIAGIEGNGQKELAELIWGSQTCEEGGVAFQGKEISSSSIQARKKCGISFIPEDRHEEGLVLEMNLLQNFYLGVSSVFLNRFWFPWRKLQTEIQKAISYFEIRCRNVFSSVQSLSGGNQQKLIVARELLSQPLLLIAAQPTRGVDIGAMERIHDVLIQRRNEGMAILLISCELDELLSLSDRILVLRDGKISREFENLEGDWDELRYQMGEAMVCPM